MTIAESTATTPHEPPPPPPPAAAARRPAAATAEQAAVVLPALVAGDAVRAIGRAGHAVDPAGAGGSRAGGDRDLVQLDVARSPHDDRERAGARDHRVRRPDGDP